MKCVRPPLLLKWLYRPGVTWKMPSEEKTIYLTFDDGPVPEITPEILDILNKFNAKASFFQVGENVDKFPQLYEMIVKEGHSTGNHTFNHLNGWSTKTDKYIDNIKKCQAVVPSKLFRPPYGKIKYKQLMSLKSDFKIIMWSVLSYDFHNRITPGMCFENVRKHTANGSIIVFHDNIKARKNVLYALPKVLNSFSEQGYEFKSIPQV